ncbi:hypothetical protein BH09BAC1_BH09BAC1_13950 [soil metagenome]
MKRFTVIFSITLLLLSAQLCLFVFGQNFYPAIVMPMFAYIPIQQNELELLSMDVELVYTANSVSLSNPDIILSKMPKHLRLWCLKLRAQCSNEEYNLKLKQWLSHTLPNADSLKYVNFYLSVGYRSASEPDIILRNERKLLNAISFAE